MKLELELELELIQQAIISEIVLTRFNSVDITASCRSTHKILVSGSHYIFSNFGAGMTIF